MSLETDKKCEKINGILSCFAIVVFMGIGGYVLYDNREWFNRPAEKSSDTQAKPRLPQHPFLKDRVPADVQGEFERVSRELNSNQSSFQPVQQPVLRKAPGSQR